MTLLIYINTSMMVTVTLPGAHRPALLRGYPALI